MDAILGMWWLFALLAAGIVALVVLKVVTQSGGGAREVTGEVEFPFERKALLSAGEKMFYRVLCECLNGQYLIFAKIKLADLIEVTKGRQDNRSHFGRISQKHVDFVLCDKKSVDPVLVIELDDRSHKRERNRKGDEVKNRALEAAGLALLRVPQRENYSTRELLEAILGKVEE